MVQVDSAMQTPIRIYECRCGQYTPVTTSAPVACSRCGRRDFSQVIWFESSRGQLESNWIQSACPPDGDLSSSPSVSQSETLSIRLLYVDDQQRSQLTISCARSMLDYLEMLYRDGDLCEEQYQAETKKILRRVIRAMRL
jgi:hypothetical protein